MSDRLAAYLHNHLAGARVAIDLLQTLSDDASDPTLRKSASELLVEVEEDRERLRSIAEHVGGSAGGLKAAATWLGEKATPLTARLGVGEKLGTLEMLETLCLGVLGKQALWKVLESVQSPRVPPTDFRRMIDRAESQHARLEAHRLAAAHKAFGASSG